jgi:hypothetical protein
LVWSGLVWLNPPYGKETQIWLQKLLDHGNGIALIFARTDTKWFQSMTPHMDFVFFLAGRLAFHRPDGSIVTTAGAPSLLIGKGQTAIERIQKSGLKGFLAKPLFYPHK